MVVPTSGFSTLSWSASSAVSTVKSPSGATIANAVANNVKGLDWVVVDVTTVAAPYPASGSITFSAS